MARVKVKDSEKLDPSNIRHVISLLESDKPITKKEACSLLLVLVILSQATKNDKR